MLQPDSLLLTVPPAMSSANNQRFEDSFQGANLVAARMLKRLDVTAQAHRTTRWSFEIPALAITTIFRELGAARRVGRQDRDGSERLPSALGAARDPNRP